MKLTTGILLGFVLGFACQYILAKQLANRNHWKAIDTYNEYVRNTSNYEKEASTGLLMATPPKNIGPDLAALVAEGELDHADLVLPTVPANRDSTQRWIDFTRKLPNIVYITGNTSYVEYAPSGIQPIHLNIWYKNSDHSMIRFLITELESTKDKDR